EDGTSALVSRGILNLAHRFGHDDPRPLEPGVPTTVGLELEATSWIFEPGHRVRLSLAATDWPNAWPPPQASELVVDRSSIELVLPTLAGPSPTTAPALHTPPRAAPDPEDEREGVP